MIDKHTNTNTTKLHGVLFALTVALFIAGYLPTLQQLFGLWANSPDYYFAFFALPVAIYMIWTKRNVLQNWKGKGITGAVLLLVATLLYCVSLRLNVPTISILLMLLWVFAAFVFIGGLKAIFELIVPVTLLVLLVPFSDSLYGMVTLPLQLKVSELSASILSAINIPIYRVGNILHAPTKVFQVVEACSGLRSLIALNCLALMLGFFTLSKNRSIMLLFAASIPVAFVVNILRVLILVVAYHYFQLDLAEGEDHFFTGALVFTVALLLLYTIQTVLNSWEAKRQ